MYFGLRRRNIRTWNYCLWSVPQQCFAVLMVLLISAVHPGSVYATDIDLADIAAARGGFLISGVDMGDRAGLSVSAAGDVNGDGLDDVIVGAYQASPTIEREGAAYVVFGKIGTAPVSLAAVESGTGGFAILGVDRDDWAGFSVSAAGDVNGDGLDDVIVGAYFGSRSYVVFGKTGTATVNLSDIISGTGGFVISGQHGQGFGTVSVAGDINGDNRDDLVVGATSAGGASVIFGKATTAPVYLADIAIGIGGFEIVGDYDTQPEPDVPFNSGAVSRAGDVNGDGIDDVIIGVFHNQPGGFVNSGRAYVVYGKRGDTNPVSLTQISDSTVDDPPLGFLITGIHPLDETGFSVSGGGDFNGDGLDDVIVGAPYTHDSITETGNAFIVFGKADTTPVALADMMSGVGGVPLMGVKAWDYTGFSVSNAGDVNGDALDDVIVGALGADTQNLSRTGRSYIVYGKQNTIPPDLGNLLVDGVALHGIDADDQSGVSVSGAGDVNGDGFDDVIIGADSAGPNNKPQAGEAYVVFGGSFDPMIWVDFNSNGVELGSFRRPYNLFGDAVAVAPAGVTIAVKGDSIDTKSSEILRINKPMVIQAVGGPVMIGVRP